MKRRIKYKKFELPIYWRDEIKVWHGMVRDCGEAWRIDNKNSAGTNNVQYYDFVLDN